MCVVVSHYVANVSLPYSLTPCHLPSSSNKRAPLWRPCALFLYSHFPHPHHLPQGLAPALRGVGSW